MACTVVEVELFDLWQSDESMNADEFKTRPVKCQYLRENFEQLLSICSGKKQGIHILKNIEPCNHVLSSTSFHPIVTLEWPYNQHAAIQPEVL